MLNKRHLDFWFPITQKGDSTQTEQSSFSLTVIVRSRFFHFISDHFFPDLASIKYQINVYTGDVKGAGTNANVFVTIYGQNGDTGERPLKQRFRDLFERNQEDKFEIEVVDLGKYNTPRLGAQ